MAGTNRKQPERSAKRPTGQWMSKTVLLVVAPWTATQYVLDFEGWLHTIPQVAWITLALCVALGGLVWRLRAGTAGAAAMGAAILGCLLMGTMQFPYTHWLRSGMSPLLATLVLTLTATRIGQHRQQETDSAEARRERNEARRGRDAAQVAANLGAAALAVTVVPFAPEMVAHNPYFAALIAYAALAEAAADTVSSEIGQAFGGVPRLVTTWRKVPPGTDGAVTISGTLAGLLAAGIVAAVGIWALTGVMGGQWLGFALILIGGCAGWMADSLLGAIAERRGWLNNDAVNFLSTLGAAAVTLMLARVVTAVMVVGPGR